MDKKTKIFALLFALIIIIGAIACYFIAKPSGGTIAVISIDGKEYSRIDLSRVKESYELVIENDFGKNILVVEPFAISISEADCPDQICVHQGKLTDNGLPIICMPHRLIISIEGSDIDA